jgi:hypothetical protein
VKKAVYVVIAVLGGLVLGCLAVLTAQWIKIRVLTYRYGKELSNVIVNYNLVMGQADAEQKPELFQTIATGEHLDYLESVTAYPSSSYDITTAATVDRIVVLKYANDQAVASAHGRFWHHIVVPKTGEESGDIESPFNHMFTFRKENGVWKIEKAEAFPPPL